MNESNGLWDIEGCKGHTRCVLQIQAKEVPVYLSATLVEAAKIGQALLAWLKGFHPWTGTASHCFSLSVNIVHDACEKKIEQKELQIQAETHLGAL